MWCFIRQSTNSHSKYLNEIHIILLKININNGAQKRANRDFWAHYRIIGVRNRLRASRQAPLSREDPGKPGLRGGNALDGKNAMGEWWARQDSNLRPDRYERSALTN